MIAANVAKKLPQKALTKGILYPTVKKVAGYLGASLTKKHLQMEPRRQFR